jgi:hypothetical protein
MGGSFDAATEETATGRRDLGLNHGKDVRTSKKEMTPGVLRCGRGERTDFTTAAH